MANFEHDVIMILIEAGNRGMKTSDICRRVYNMHCSLFSTMTIDDVSIAVKRDLNRLLRRSIVKKTSERAVYTINNKSDVVMQIQFMFTDNDESTDDSHEAQCDAGQELSLF